MYILVWYVYMYMVFFFCSLFRISILYYPNTRDFYWEWRISPKPHHISSCRRQLGWLSVVDRRKSRVLSLLYSILFDPQSPTYLSSDFAFPLSIIDPYVPNPILCWPLPVILQGSCLTLLQSLESGYGTNYPSS